MYLGPCQASMMVLFFIVQSLTVFAKASIIEVWYGSEYFSAYYVRWKMRFFFNVSIPGCDWLVAGSIYVKKVNVDLPKLSSAT